MTRKDQFLSVLSIELEESARNTSDTLRKTYDAWTKAAILRAIGSSSIFDRESAAKWMGLTIYQLNSRLSKPNAKN